MSGLLWGGRLFSVQARLFTMQMQFFIAILSLVERSRRI